MSGLRRRALDYTAGNLVAQILSTATGIALARLLTLEDLGSYRQVLLVAGTCAGMLSLGLPLSIFYFLPRAADRHGQGVVVGRVIAIGIGVGLLGGLLILLLRSRLAVWLKNPELLELLPWALPLVLSLILVRSVAPGFLSLKYAGTAGLLRVLQVAVSSAAVLTAILLGRPLFEILGSYALADIFLVGFALYLLHRKLPFRLRAGDITLPTQLVYALPLALSALVGLMSRQIDQFMVSGWFDPSTFAQYSVGAAELPLMPLLVSSAASVLLPGLSALVAKEDFAGYREEFRVRQRQLALLCLPLTMITIVLAKPLLVVLYGDEFARSAPVFQFYALVSINRLFLSGTLLQSLGRTRLVLVGEVLFLVLNIVGNYFALQHLGFYGPAMATWVAGLCIMLFNQVILARREETNPFDLFDVRALIRFSLLSLLAAAPVWWLMNQLPASLLSLAGLGLAYGVLAYLLFWNLGGLRDSERTMLDPRRLFRQGGRS